MMKNLKNYAIYDFLKKRYFLRVFGIGLSRTGTKSLTLALKALGFKSFHYPPSPELMKYLKEYDALTDTPIALNFKRLDEMYPNSKFILTIRDLNSWLESCKKHFMTPTVLRPWQIELRKEMYGTQVWNEERFKKTYFCHLEKVKEYFKNREGDLLIINIVNGDGYKKLCSFLRKPIPKKPFPHEKK